MPYSKQKNGDKWDVINSDTKEVKGTHDSESEANAQLAAIYANEPGLTKSLPSIPKQVLVPIQKYDAKTHMVYGWGAVEEPDNANEILDYETSKPEMLKWSEGVSKRSGGKSKGNLREMHQEIAAGRLMELRPDDEHKAFYVAAEVVDPISQEKVEKGVLNAFSIGGNYGRVWPDSNPMYKRYTALPVELSLVDAPCAPTAIITMTKVDGVNEDVAAQPGTGETKITLATTYNQKQQAITAKLSELYPETTSDGIVSSYSNYYVIDLDDTKAIVSCDGKYYSVPYSIDADGKAILGEMVEVVQKVSYETLSKVLPTSPMPMSEIRLDSNPPSPTTEHVERLPDPNVTSVINPDNIDGKALAAQTVNTRDLTADLDAWMPKLESAMRKVIQEEIKKALPSVPAPAKMIPVKTNFIKVRSNQ